MREKMNFANLAQTVGQTIKQGATQTVAPQPKGAKTAKAISDLLGIAKNVKEIVRPSQTYVTPPPPQPQTLGSGINIVIILAVIVIGFLIVKKLAKK